MKWLIGLACMAAALVLVLKPGHHHAHALLSGSALAWVIGITFAGALIAAILREYE